MERRRSISSSTFRALASSKCTDRGSWVTYRSSISGAKIYIGVQANSFKVGVWLAHIEQVFYLLIYPQTPFYPSIHYMYSQEITYVADAESTEI